jgi:uncharacterized repeat protein (TIGR03917 family)
MSAPNAGYSGTPLPKKLGIKEGSTVWLAGAVPAGFAATLGELPDGARLVKSAGDPDLTLFFVRRARDLAKLPAVAERGGHALWICWPKKTSPLAVDLNEDLVRQAGLDLGLVDYKVCAVDADWSGLKFARRKA